MAPTSVWKCCWLGHLPTANCCRLSRSTHQRRARDPKSHKAKKALLDRMGCTHRCWSDQLGFVRDPETVSLGHPSSMWCSLPWSTCARAKMQHQASGRCSPVVVGMIT